MVAASTCLRKLEKFPDLENGVILATKIHQVLKAINKTFLLTPNSDQEPIEVLISDMEKDIRAQGTFCR